MAVEKDFELLDDYLGNRLSGEERTIFEQKLKADFDLKTEHQLQQKLIEGIRNARMAELKSMLKNTPVPAKGIETILTKIAALCVVGGLIGAGVYFFSQNNTSETENETPQIQQPIAIEQPEETKETLSSKTEKEAVREIKRTKRHRISKNIITPATVDTSSSKVEENVAEKRKLEVFDPTRENDATSSHENEDLESSVEISASIAVETDNTNKKYTFHYQFKSDKLLLYGSFEKNLYEILEFFSENKRTVFLYYKESYYLLNEDTEKVKPLVAITDTELLKKLKEYREK